MCRPRSSSPSVPSSPPSPTASIASAPPSGSSWASSWARSSCWPASSSPRRRSATVRVPVHVHRPASSTPRGSRSDRALNRPAARGAGLVITAAVGYGTLGVLARLAGEAGISTITFVTWRAAIGSILLALCVALALHLRLIRPVRLTDVPRAHRLQVAAVAVLSIVANLAMFAGFERTAIAYVMICFYTYPVIVAVTATRLYGDRLGPQRVAALAIALAGLCLMVLTPTRGEMANADPVGLALGFVAAFAQAGYALIAGRGYASLPAAQAAVAVTSLSAIGFVLVASSAAPSRAWVSHSRPVTHGSGSSSPVRWGWPSRRRRPVRLQEAGPHAGFDPHAARTGRRRRPRRRAARRATGAPPAAGRPSGALGEPPRPGPRSARAERPTRLRGGSDEPPPVLPRYTRRDSRRRTRADRFGQRE